MTRWYYDDPLAAQWMAKHFGMLFQVEVEKDGHTAVITCAESMLKPASWPADIDQLSIRFFIHPDSLHLLDPQVGDITAQSLPSLIQNAADAASARIFLPMGLRIIERNGIPFHWPKQVPAAEVAA